MAHLAPNATSVSLMSRILKFDRRQLVALQQNLTHIAARDGDPWIASFEEYEEMFYRASKPLQVNRQRIPCCSLPEFEVKLKVYGFGLGSTS